MRPIGSNASMKCHVLMLIVSETLHILLIPVDPAGDCCYWGSTKPCKSGSNAGVRLSNTSIICPQVGDTLGKLRIISDSRGHLEGVLCERQRLRMSRRLIRLLAG